MRLRHILEVMPFDKWVWFTDDTCEWLGFVPNTYGKVESLLNKDKFRGLRECNVTALEPLGVGGIRVGLEQILKEVTDEVY